MQKKYSQIELKELVKKIIISTKGKDKIAFNVESGLQIAYGYTRVQTSTFGVYIEFSLKQIYMPILYFSTQGNPHFFIWHPDNNPEVDILQPKDMIEGTSFLPDRFYIDPKELFTHGMRVMKTT